jgi:hypothetical protein
MNVLFAEIAVPVSNCEFNLTVCEIAELDVENDRPKRRRDAGRQVHP